MAEKRMFSKTIIDSDVFLDMPQSTQNLYFHLNMRADDEGFVNSPKKIMRMIGAAQNDIDILLSKRYILGFESGVVVIKHWKLHNAIRKDRLKPTVYVDEKSILLEKENGTYTDTAVMAQPDVRQVADERVHRLDKVRLDKVRLEEKPKRKRFTPPTIEDIKSHCLEKGYNVNADKFFYHYESNGWMVGRNKMKSWQMALGKWNTDSKPIKKEKPDNEIPEGMTALEFYGSPI